MKCFKISPSKNTVKTALRFLSAVIVIINISINKSFAFPANPPFPKSLECKVQPYYKYRKDGKAGREIFVIFKDSKLYGSATVKVECNSITEESIVNNPEDVSQLS